MIMTSVFSNQLVLYSYIYKKKKTSKNGPKEKLV